MKIIGYTRDSYAERRNFLNLPLPHIRFVRKFDLYSLNRKINQLRNKQNWFSQFTHKPIPLSERKVDGYHFFNTISESNKPYIVTFETTIPRWKSNTKHGLRLLQKSNCISIIAISQRAYDFQFQLILKYFGDKSELLDKLKIIPPAQVPLVQSTKTEINDVIRFIFVGDLFFLKGGYESVLAFEKLISEKKNLTLTIVSRLETDQWFTGSDSEDVEAVLKIISENKNISLYSGIDNDKVLNLLKNHDVCLLPSFAETYGYSLLESMASGCPIITTNCGAFTEINNEERGWIINLPLNELRQVIIDRNDHGFCQELYQQLLSVLQEIMDEPSSIKTKSKNALEYIERVHDPQKIAKAYMLEYDKF